MSLADKAMLVKLSIQGWTCRKFDKEASQDVQAARKTSDDAGRYNKLLIAKTATEKMTTLARAARTFHYNETLPWMDEGTRILPSKNFFNYNVGINKFKEEYLDAVDNFTKNYSRHVAEAQIRLQSLYNPADYPDASDLANKFQFDVSILPVPEVQDFRVDVGDSEVTRIKEELTETLAKQEAVALKQLCERAFILLDKIGERLTNPDSNIHGSLFSKSQELIPLLRVLNFAENKIIYDLADEFDNKVAIFEANDVRSDLALRARVGAAAKDISRRYKELTK